MSVLRNARGHRRSDWFDHVLAALGCLLATAALGAVLTLAANAAETMLGLSADRSIAVAALWVLGIGLMSAPLAAWPAVPVGGLFLIAARHAGFGGWAVAVAISLLLSAILSREVPASVADGLIRVLIAAAPGFFYWKIIDIRTKPGAYPPFTDH